LRGDRRGDRTVRAGAETHAHELRQATRLPRGARERRGHPRQMDAPVSPHATERGTDVHVEADERRDGIPGQAEDETAAEPTAGERLPGLLRDLPEHLLD